MNNANEQKTEEERTPLEKKKERSKKRKSMLDNLIAKQRAGSAESIESLTKRKREEKERIKAEREFLRKFEKTRKIGRLSTKEEIIFKKKTGNKEETKKSTQDKRQRKRLIKEIMRNIKKELINTKGEIRKEIKEFKEE